MKRVHLLWLSLLLGCHRSESGAPGPSEPVRIAMHAPSCADAVDCERACGAGIAAACVEAGRLYEYGHAGPNDPARAFPLYERSCALGNAVGCFNTAILLEAGRGTSKDLRRAAALYGQVCRMGSNTGCRRAENLTPALNHATP